MACTEAGGGAMTSKQNIGEEHYYSFEKDRIAEIRGTGLTKTLEIEAE